MADQDRRLTDAHRSYEPCQVRDDRREIVARCGLVAFTVAALVHGYDPIPLVSQERPSQIPDVAARAKTVHK